MAETFNFKQFLMENGFSYTNKGNERYYHIKKDGKEYRHKSTAKNPANKTEATKWLKDLFK